MADTNTWTIAEARDKLRAKEITSEELTLSCIAAIDAADPLVRSFIKHLMRRLIRQNQQIYF
jgi:Asp-tRNA(Asn)/Glu-tRNA(Gln) amidotransferase A subunit family amidase